VGADLGEADTGAAAVLPELPELAGHRCRHVGPEVAGSQLLEAARAPDLEGGGVGPEHAAAVDVEHPHRRRQPVRVGRRVSRRPITRRRGRPADRDPVETITARRSQRAAAIGSVLRSFSSFAVLGIAVVMVLGELGVNLAPILASAGVIGVALGFGAQNLVKDFIAGIGIILEDQYGVGDVVDLGEASGTVEAVGLRITRLRDVNGVVWYARNGEILRVGNKSQGYAQVVIDMPVAHDTDLDRCRTVLQEVADEMYAEEEWAGVLLAEPESLGVEMITAEGVVMRLQVRTTNAEQWRVGRELRLRLKERLAVEGIRTPVPLLSAVGTPAGAS
jgi:small conductance mechanosensitive channel